jgi:transketolase
MASQVNITSESLAQKARVSTIRMTAEASAAHVGSSLSVIDILSVLYHETRIENVKRDNSKSLIFVSKGHAAAGTYAVMAHSGCFPLEWLDSYCKNDSPLIGHVNKRGVPGVNHSTGSLGHALPFAAGKALAAKIQGEQTRFFVVLSDGECDEGSNWEAALVASHLVLKNLTILIDRNRLQSLKSTEDTVALEPFADKWKAFGWSVDVVNGHDHGSIRTAVFGDYEIRTTPKVVICETTKGHGVSFMENSVLWHYKPPSGEFLSLALEELGEK